MAQLLEVAAQLRAAVDAGRSVTVAIETHQSLTFLTREGGTLLCMENWWANAIWSLTPTVLIGIFFFVVLRIILRADRTERRVYQRMETEERAKLGLPPKTDA